MAKVLLIDGSNYLFRAYHAMPPLTTTAGEPTGAIKGFFGMLSKVAAAVKPDRAAVVFDAPGKTFRHERFPEYKANRPPMPDDLRVQIAPLQEGVRLLGWPVYVVPGIEADDVIASFTRLAREAGDEVVIATGDKDLAQLVGEGISLLNTMNDKFYDRAGVLEKYGVPPERIVDYLSLMGDKVDNVPGIKGCGPKTAAKWIAQWGSLDGLIEHADEVPGKAGENLRAGLPFLEDARALVTVKRDAVVPGVGAAADLAFRDADEAALERFAKRWQMSAASVSRAKPGAAAGRVRSAAKAAPDAFAPVHEPSAAFEENDLPYVRVSDEAGLTGLLGALAQPRAEPVALALLYDGEARKADVGAAAFALSPLEVYVVESTPGFSASAALEALRPWFESEAPKTMHDAKTALHAFARAGIRVSGRIDDVMLMDYVLEAHLPHELPKLARRHLSRSIPQRDAVLGKGAKRLGWRDADPDAVARLLAEEAAAVRALHAHFSLGFASDAKSARIYHEIERPLLPVLFEMEATGVEIDGGMLLEESRELAQKIDRLKAEAAEAAGREFNLASPKQLAEVLFTDMGIPVRKKTASGTPSTDEEVLGELALDYPIARIVLEHRRLSKLRSTYLEKLPRMIDPADGRVHTTFGQATAVTGRLASSEPNLQNIPARTPEGRRIRTAFRARPGSVIVDADYSQIELRIMAHLSQDEALLGAFARGEDIHRSTASEVFGVPLERVTAEERRMAKVINFGLIYGMSAFGLAQQLGLDRKVAANYVEQYFHRFPGVKRYMDEARLSAAALGYVETLFGRRLWIPEIRSPKRMLKAAAERAAINAPMQGTAADLIKMAMIAVDRWLREEGLASKLVLQVHDELIIEAPEAEAERVREALPKLMAEVARLSVPLIAEVGVASNWGEAH